MIHVKQVGDFNGEDVVLLAFDTEGRDAFLHALTQARREGTARLQRPHRTHEFRTAPGPAAVELGDDFVLWRFSPAALAEVTEMMTSMGGRPGHHFVDDMLGPASTLVLSFDEYLTPNWLIAGREPIFTYADLD